DTQLAQLNTQRLIAAGKGKENINIMYETRSVNNYNEIKGMIEKAEIINMIGFGFDRDNLDVLGFPNKLKTEFYQKKIIRYLNYKGEMTSLSKQFEAIDSSRKEDDDGVIIESTNTLIEKAYQHDFRALLF
ncbi:MAG: hypothetical protein JKY13_00715, partial [Gammaproteobacteria bacterium]|nr:hypothetical protein [Gammaproteobacteria bacterium]